MSQLLMPFPFPFKAYKTGVFLQDRKSGPAPQRENASQKVPVFCGFRVTSGWLHGSRSGQHALQKNS
jgi:hypothetical protein